MAKEGRTYGRRWAAAAGVATVTTLMLGLPLAGTASAAATAVSATPSSQSVPVGNNATIGVTSTGTPTSISYTFIAGGPSAAPAFPAATACNNPTSATTASCTVTDSTEGTDTVRVFDDTNNNGSYDAGEPFQNVTVIFSGEPFSLAIAPTSHSDATGSCAAFTVTATDQGGRVAGGRTIKMEITETSGSGSSNFLSVCAPSGGSAPTQTSNTTASGTDTLVVHAPTDATGKALFGFTSTATGTAAVTAFYDTGSNTPQPGDPKATASETFTAGGTDAAASLTVSPTSSTQYAGTTVPYTVTVRNSSGQVLSGVVVNYVVTSGPDATGPYGNNPPTCGSPTDSSGQANCSLPSGGGSVANGSTSSTDSITFWVNQSSGATPGPDAGEPKATANATFATPPTFTRLKVTCPTPGAAAPSGNTNASCNVPVTQHSVTFTAHVTNAGAPVSGADVTFTITGSGVGGSSPTTSPTSQTVTTGSDGTASLTVTNTSPANNDSITATAQIGASGTTGSASATWQTPAANSIALTPTLQTASIGGSVTVTARVTDQFGAGVSGVAVSFTVSQRNAGKAGSANTNAAGDATFTYQDTGVNGTLTQDTVTATAGSFSDTATVDYVTGSSTASNLAIDVSDNCDPGGSNGSTTHNVANLSDVTQVCVLVKNANNEVLPGTPVTFTVNDGQVDTSAPDANSTKTVTANADSNGVASAFVTSTTSGNQTVTATAGTGSVSGILTYPAPGATAARNVTLMPSAATVAPNGQQMYSATVVDQYGNGVPGVTVTFTVTNGGTFGTAATSQQVVTNAGGIATVTLTVPSTTGTSGQVTADITAGSGGPNQCHADAGANNTPPAGNCTATADYTVGSAPAVDTVSITGVQNPGVAGQLITVSGMTLDGAHVTVTGWNPVHGSYTVGTVTADGSGHWTTSLVVWYNTVVAAHEGTAVSANQWLGVHQVAHFTKLKLRKHTRSGYHYVLKGYGSPGLANEFAQVQWVGGTPLGSAHADSTGHFTIRFTIKKKGRHSLYLYLNGRRNGMSADTAFRQHFTLNQK